MKSEIMPAIVQIDGALLKELTNEVRETLAKDVLQQSKTILTKSFAAVDLWRIQKNKKSANIQFKSNF
jgi:hypothetical protein